MRQVATLFLVFAFLACKEPQKEPLSQIISDEKIVAYTFSENEKFGLLDSSLNVILKPKYDYIFGYQDYGVIKTDNGGERINGGDYMSYESSKIGLIDLRGNILFEPQFNQIQISDGSAKVESDDRYGYVDLKGNFLIKPKFLEAWPEINDVAPVKEDSLWGIVKMSDEYLIEPTFLDLSEFSDGIAYFRKHKQGNYGYINTKGHVLIDSLSGAGTFQYGFGPINKNYKWGIIDSTGKVIVEPQYDESINIMKRDGEIWIMQYDDEQKDWKKIEKLKSW
jgi:hypothetical protein